MNLLLLRRVEPLLGEALKRVVKAPKVYLRDSGLTHALLGITTEVELFRHPVARASWAGFVVESLIAAAPPRTRVSFYRTLDGASIDLVLDVPSGGRWAVDIWHEFDTPPERVRPRKGFLSACDDLEADRLFIVHEGQGRHSVTDEVEAVGVRDLAVALSSKRAQDVRAQLAPAGAA
jgi:predicted AAA+ superfamily ATPase